MHKQDPKIASGDRGYVDVLRILQKSEKLYGQIEREITERHQSQHAGLRHGSANDYDAVYTWVSEGSYLGRARYFHNYAYPNTAEEICHTLSWMMQEISSGSKTNTRIFCLAPENVIKPFLDVVYCEELSLESSVVSLNGMILLLSLGLIDDNAGYLRYVAIKLASAFSVKKSRNLDSNSKLNGIYGTKLLEAIKLAVCRDNSFNVFDLHNYWTLLELCMESGHQCLTEDQLLDMINFMIPRMAEKLKRCWEVVEAPLNIMVDRMDNRVLSTDSVGKITQGASSYKQGNTRMAWIESKQEYVNSYIDSTIQSLRSHHLSIERTCNSCYRLHFVRSCCSVSAVNSSDYCNNPEDVNWSTLDPLVQSPPLEYVAENVNSNPKAIESSAEYRNYPSIKLALEPEDLSHIISSKPGRWPEKALSEGISRSDSCPIHTNVLKDEYRCKLCDTATLVLVIQYVMRRLGNPKERGGRLCRLSLKLMSLLVSYGHVTISQMVTVGQKILLRNYESTPPASSAFLKEDTIVKECHNSDALRGNADYFALRRTVSKNFFLCGKLLLQHILRVYKLVREDIFCAVFDDLQSIQKNAGDHKMVQLPIREEIDLIGCIFSSDLLSLLWSCLEWYLTWIVKSFDSNYVIDNGIILSILGANSRIYSLEMRRGDFNSLAGDTRILEIILDSVLMIFSDPKTLQLLYARCDSNENFPIYLLEDFVYFLSKISDLSQYKTQQGSSEKRIGIKSSRLLRTLLYQTLPKPGYHIDLSVKSEEKVRRSRKLLKDECIMVLNLNIEEGLKKACELGFIPPKYTEDDIAIFFYSNPGISRFTLWNYLSKPAMASLLGKFISLFNLSSVSVVNSIRILTDRVQISGEAQQISRLLDAFSETYFEQNKDLDTFIPKNENSVYTLTYSIMMLNTDLHNAQVLRKMTFDDFRINLSGMNNGSDYPPEFLREIFESIRMNEIKGSSCEYERYFNTVSYLLKAPVAVPDIPESLEIIWRREISDIIWRPALVAIHISFAYSRDTYKLIDASEAYRKIPTMAIAYGNTELADGLIYSLCGISGISANIPPNIVSYQEGCIHCDDTKLPPNVTPQTIAIETHLDLWSVYFGSRLTHQLATILLFEVLDSCSNLIDTSWTQLVTLMQNLFLHSALPRSLMVQWDLITGETPIKLIPPTKDLSKGSKKTAVKNVYRVKDLSYLKSSISKVLGMGTYQNNEFSPMEKSSENIILRDRTTNCISSCKIRSVIENSRFYTEKTLVSLSRAIIECSFADRHRNKYRKSKIGGANVKYRSENARNNGVECKTSVCSNNKITTQHDGDGEVSYHPAAVFNLNLLFELICRNMDRYPQILQIFEEHAMKIIKDAKTCPDHLLSCAFTSLFSIILNLLHKEGYTYNATRLAEEVAELAKVSSQHAKDIVTAGLFMILDHRTITSGVEPTETLKICKLLGHFLQTDSNAEKQPHINFINALT